MSVSPYNSLQEYFNRLFSLNPYREDIDQEAMFATASELPASCFEEFRNVTEELLTAFLTAQWKINEQTIINKFIDHLEKADYRLRSDADEDEENADSLQSDNRTAGGDSVALVSRRYFRSADWLRALNKGNLPQPLLRSVDAAVQRNRLLPSILKPAFVALHGIDSDAAFEWELEYLKNNTGQLDPDVIRALMQTWRRQDKEPLEAVEWALQWSTNPNLRRQWPAVVEEADLWLREITIQKWLDRQSRRSKHIALLQRLSQKSAVNEQDYWRWTEATIADIGIEIRRFSSLSAAAFSADNSETKKKIQLSLLHRLQNMDSLFTALIIMSDLLPRMPDGAYRLALALFGISHSHLQKWRQDLQENAFSVIQKIFLDNLKSRHPPLETIKKFTFGDRQLYQHLVNYLDIISKNFTSLEDRDAVTETLAINYASFRESDLLAKHIGRRYRHLMSALHEDNLRRLFTDRQYEGISSLETLFDAFSLAASARQYLKTYRSLDSSTAELLGAEEDFTDEVKRLRMKVIDSLCRER